MTAQELFDRLKALLETGAIEPTDKVTFVDFGEPKYQYDVTKLDVHTDKELRLMEE